MNSLPKSTPMTPAWATGTMRQARRKTQAPTKWEALLLPVVAMLLLVMVLLLLFVAAAATCGCGGSSEGWGMRVPCCI